MFVNLNIQLCLQEKYEEKFVGSSRNSGSFQNRIPSEEKQIKPGVNSGMSIRTVTFYKADTDEDQNEDQNGPIPFITITMRIYYSS